MTDGRFAGQVAVVTGAAGGIGRAIAQRLAAEGAYVVAADREPVGVRETVDGINAAGASASASVLDLTDRTARAQVIPDILADHERLDVLVNNAAYHGERRQFLESAEGDFDRVVETNLVATAALCKSAAEQMSSVGSGAIVNIAAIQAVLPVPTYAAYAASKGGIVALTRALAVELSPCGVRVNAVAPGVIETASFAATLSDEGTGPPPTAAVPALLRRSGHPDEVASAVAFLASGDASYITGTVLTVDGGRSLSRLSDPFQQKLGVD